MSEPKNKSPSSDSSSSKPAASASASEPSISEQQAYAHFNKLREEQRLLSQKALELENEAHEYGVVIQTLSGVAEDRRCFRLLGGILVERTVGEVVPQLTEQKKKIEMLAESMHDGVADKGKELNDWRLKYNIKFYGEDSGAALANKISAQAEALNVKEKKPEGPTGVLVAPS